MNKSLVVEMVALLLLLMVFSSGALYADPVRPDFRLRIETGDGQGVVITDNGAMDANPNGGQITFQGFISNLYYGGITVAWSKPETASGTTVLELQSQMGRFQQCSAINPCTASSSRLIISLEDDGYSYPASTASLTGDITGVNVANGTGSFQTWLNFSNSEPNFGSDTTASTQLAAVIPNPIGSDPASAALFQGSGVNGGYQSTLVPPAGFEDFASFNVQNPYALFSQAVIDFSTTAGGGTAYFDLKSTVGPDRNGRPLINDTATAPEPTSLLLLGSGMVALGLLRNKKKPAA